MKSKKITSKPKGISVVYEECASCPVVRPDERPLLVKPGNQCAHCYGILWAAAYKQKQKKFRLRKKVAR